LLQSGCFSRVQSIGRVSIILGFVVLDALFIYGHLDASAVWELAGWWQFARRVRDVLSGIGFILPVGFLVLDVLFICRPGASAVWELAGWWQLVRLVWYILSVTSFLQAPISRGLGTVWALSVWNNPNITKLYRTLVGSATGHS